MTPREAGIQAFYADESTTNTLQGLNAAFDAYEAAITPVGEAVEFAGSLHDLTVIKWASGYQPAPGTKLYAKEA
ncbi:hypothetical protein [Aminobacter sp. MDW-2]|uniref:hypothetical protein n=1 Tax=Aminobacter sp. MDW-2 TaxID=2666139 RepID=UPI0012B0068B|nr:hypothetical protein [Aminobacter sp. MDW-2]MRX31883.1 hypothetical protein [Aminobacter sp. MDW-2]QNH32359.1 hypothetical protein H5P29_17555 [Aminobacter sp. MDW-2]